MFLVWRGHGYLVVVFCLLGVAASSLLTDFAGLPDNPTAMAVCGAVGYALWVVGKRLNDPLRERLLLDPVTGETVRLVDRHDLFWIRMEYWCVAPALVWLWLLGEWVLTGIAGQ